MRKREELCREHIATLVEGKEKVVSNLREKLSWLEEKGVKIPGSVWEKVDGGEQLVIEAKNLISTPGCDVHEVLKIIELDNSQ